MLGQGRNAHAKWWPNWSHWSWLDAEGWGGGGERLPFSSLDTYVFIKLFEQTYYFYSHHQNYYNTIFKRRQESIGEGLDYRGWTLPCITWGPLVTLAGPAPGCWAELWEECQMSRWSVDQKLDGKLSLKSPLQARVPWLGKGVLYRAPSLAPWDQKLWMWAGGVETHRLLSLEDPEHCVLTSHCLFPILFPLPGVQFLKTEHLLSVCDSVLRPA